SFSAVSPTAGDGQKNGLPAEQADDKLDHQANAHGAGGEHSRRARAKESHLAIFYVRSGKESMLVRPVFCIRAARGVMGNPSAVSSLASSRTTTMWSEPYRAALDPGIRHRNLREIDHRFATT